jgi:hypothetical protein
MTNCGVSSKPRKKPKDRPIFGQRSTIILTLKFAGVRLITMSNIIFQGDWVQIDNVWYRVDNIEFPNILCLHDGTSIDFEDQAIEKVLSERSSAPRKGIAPGFGSKEMMY